MFDTDIVKFRKDSYEEILGGNNYSKSKRQFFILFQVAVIGDVQDEYLESQIKNFPQGLPVEAVVTKYLFIYLFFWIFSKFVILPFHVTVLIYVFAMQCLLQC